jgi:DNA topoisomerase IB
MWWIEEEDEEVKSDDNDDLKRKFTGRGLIYATPSDNVSTC